MLRCGLAGVRFENYETFISIYFPSFSGGGEPRITETAGTESVNTEARLIYFAM
jgi:hypothetical protein